MGPRGTTNLLSVKGVINPSLEGSGFRECGPIHRILLRYELRFLPFVNSCVFVPGAGNLSRQILRYHPDGVLM